MGKLLLSHRYNQLSLLPSRPGEVQRELVVRDLPGAKVKFIFVQAIWEAFTALIFLITLR